MRLARCQVQSGDKPIVYVADCVANQYVAAKYTKNAMWRSYYARYKNVQDIIYRSGGFMSSAQLSRDGANYSNVSRRVKRAVLAQYTAKLTLMVLLMTIMFTSGATEATRQTAAR